VKWDVRDANDEKMIGDSGNRKLAGLVCKEDGDRRSC